MPRAPRGYAERPHPYFPPSHCSTASTSSSSVLTGYTSPYTSPNTSVSNIDILSGNLAECLDGYQCHSHLSLQQPLDSQLMHPGSTPPLPMVEWSPGNFSAPQFEEDSSSEHQEGWSFCPLINITSEGNVSPASTQPSQDHDRTSSMSQLLTVPTIPYSVYTYASSADTLVSDYVTGSSPSLSHAYLQPAQPLMPARRERQFRQIVGSMSMRQAGRSRRKSGKPTFACNVPGCGADFTSQSNLKAHIKSHWGIKDIVCTFCGKAFTIRHVWKRHLKSIACRRSRSRNQLLPEEFAGRL